MGWASRPHKKCNLDVEQLKAMLDNETKKDSTHSQEVLSVTEVAETKDKSKSEVQAEPGDKSWFGSVFGAVSASASAVGSAAASAGSAIVDTASAVGSAAASAGSAIVDTASAVGNAAGTAGSAIVDTASAVGNAAVSAGSAIFVNTASAVGNAAASAGSAAMQVPNFFGSSLVFISQSPILKKLTENFKIDWLVMRSIKLMS